MTSYPDVTDFPTDAERKAYYRYKRFQLCNMVEGCKEIDFHLQAALIDFFRTCKDGDIQGSPSRVLHQYRRCAEAVAAVLRP